MDSPVNPPPPAETRPPENRPRPFWQRRSVWVLLLVLAAVGYYGSYFQHGINFRDEGGTITLLGQRVMNGEVPFRDVVLGYNVGWFFPIAALFKLTGVSFVALRVYFFALSTLAAVLGFLTVERAGRHAGLRWSAVLTAFAVGLLLIAVPGMTFKNYNPLAAVANSWALLGFILAADARSAKRSAFLGGLILGATWLVRIDIGTFFTIIWLGAIAARGLEREWKGRAATLAISLALLLLGILIPHAPVVWDAHQRGYLQPFAESYPHAWQKLGQDLTKAASGAKAPVPAVATATPKTKVAALPAPSEETKTPSTEATTAAKPAPQPSGTLTGDTLKRTTWSNVSAAKGEKHDDLLGLFLLTYLPLLSLLPLTLWAGFRWLRAATRGGDTRTPLAALAVLGGALTMFPQYFFWRPDAPHLSEFGPGFWCGAVGAALLLGTWGASWRSPSRWLLAACAAVLAAHAGIWLWRMAPDRWCGTIAARANRKTWFEGDNGVRIYEQQKTVEWMKEVLLTVHERSRPSEYLVAYPYHPSFNVFTNRPTYEKNVYVDNATAGPRWNEDAIQRIERFKPKVIIISGWSVNGNAASRFKNWAAPVYAHIRSRYESYGAFGDKKGGTLSEEDTYELFIRRGESASATSP